MRLGNPSRLAACCVLLSGHLFAAKLTGKVTNGTTNKPAVGEEVVLVSLEGGMQETAKGTTDSKGQFSLDVPDEGIQHLIRVSHQGVNYFRSAPQGTTTVEVTIYDSAKKVDNLIGEGRVFRVQTADRQQLRVSEMYILRNESQPPRTWMGVHTLEVVLPEGASLEEGMAAGPGGMPVSSSPVPTGAKNHYAFTFPIRPGRSQLQVTYKLPYGGSHDFSVSPDIPLAEFGVMLPKGMRFTSSGETFSAAGDESGMSVFVAKSLSPGQQLKFSLAGEGTAPREAQGGNMGAGERSTAAPGGGLGPPSGAANPLSGSYWYLVGTMLVALTGGAFWMMRRKAGTAMPAGPGSPASRPPTSRKTTEVVSHPQQPTSVSSSVLDAVKEELFQLETDRLQGKISQQDYNSAKNGLDLLLRRQIKEA